MKVLSAYDEDNESHQLFYHVKNYFSDSLDWSCLDFIIYEPPLSFYILIVIPPKVADNWD